jgi:hypothetical protein
MLIQPFCNIRKNLLAVAVSVRAMSLGPLQG